MGSIDFRSDPLSAAKVGSRNFLFSLASFPLCPSPHSVLGFAFSAFQLCFCQGEGTRPGYSGFFPLSTTTFFLSFLGHFRFINLGFPNFNSIFFVLLFSPLFNCGLSYFEFVPISHFADLFFLRFRLRSFLETLTLLAPFCLSLSNRPWCRGKNANH